MSVHAFPAKRPLSNKFWTIRHDGTRSTIQMGAKETMVFNGQLHIYDEASDSYKPVDRHNNDLDGWRG